MVVLWYVALKGYTLPLDVFLSVLFSFFHLFLVRVVVLRQARKLILSQLSG